MIEGITILNEYPIMDYEFNSGAFIIGAILISFVAFTIWIAIVDDFPVVGMFLSILIGAASSFLLCGVGFAKEVPTDRMEYQVTIEDSVAINDIYEKYEVIDKQGDIWTIQIKETED